VTRRTNSTVMPAIVLVLLGLFFIYLTPSSDNEAGIPNTTDGTVKDTVQKLVGGSVEIQTGDKVQEVAYYHCGSSEASAVHLVLLHGASFSKENWKRSGILESLCENHSDLLSVTAMDLSVRSSHEDLKATFHAMKEEPLNINFPVALVTPSASGKAIVDWMKNGNIQELPEFVHEWIPVACHSVASATDPQLSELAALENFGVFAIYGNKDSSGKKISQKLGTFGAKVLELEGGHSVYLDSPTEFYKAVVEDLQVA